MTPRDLSLLQCVKRAIADMSPAVANEEHKGVLRTLEISLNELLLRQDNGFYLQFYQQGLHLIKAGIALGFREPSGLEHLPDQLSSESSNLVIDRRIGDVSQMLDAITKGAGYPQSGTMHDYMNRISDWEIGLYAHRLTQADNQETASQPQKFTKHSVQSYLRSKFPADVSLEVTSYSRILGGYSKLTIMFSTSVPLFGCTEFVIRAEQAAIIPHPSGRSENEFPVMQFAYEQGIRIPEPLWVELDSDRLGARFVVSRKAKGSVYGTTIGASSQLEGAVLQDLARELVKIHSVKVDGENPLVMGSDLSQWAAIPTLRENALYKCEYWQKMLRDSPHSHSPLITRCFNWLMANIPETDDAASLVHGDYGLHNILIEEGNVSAVLDWEITHFGDRAQDIIWLVICLTGTASRDDVLKLYHEAGGAPVSDERLRFYDVYMSLALLIVCNIALARLDAAGQNPALADIGLRAMRFFADRARAQIG